MLPSTGAPLLLPTILLPPDDTSADAAPPAVEDSGNGNGNSTITNVDQEGGDTEVFQNPDGSLVDQFGNNVTDTGDLVDPTSAVNANGELLNGGGNGTSADVGITNVADEKGDSDVFQNPDGSLVDQFGNPVTDTGDLVDPTTAVDADGNLLNPGPDDAAAAAGAGNSTSTLLGITNVVDETGDQTVFQNPDGTLVDQFGNNVTDVGDLIDPTTAVDASGNPLNPGAAGIKNVADEQGDQTVFANPDGSLEGDLVDPGTAVDAEGNFLNAPADDGASADAEASAEDAGAEDDASAAPPPADNASADDASADDASADDATADDAAADDATADDTTADDAATDDTTADASSNSTAAAGTSTLLTITNVVDEDGDTTAFQNPDGTLVDQVRLPPLSLSHRSSSPQFGNNVTDTGDLVDPTTAVDAKGNPLNPGAAGIKNVADEKGDQTVFQNPDGSLVDQFGNPVTEAGDLVDPTTATTTTKTFGGCISVTGNVNLKAGVVGSFFGASSFLRSEDIFDDGNGGFVDANGTPVDESGLPLDGSAPAAADDAAAAPVVDDGSEDIFDDGNGGFEDAAGNAVDDTGLPLATRRRRFTRTEPPVTRSLERRINLTCPVGVGNKKSSITKGTVKAGSVTSEAPKTT
ncbi:hypothetical protein C8R46DRAFT_1082091 [Mycena filopes]|nr:hypothetical protein C8R46DRAFT_1082091 [Mycena filopes]